MARNKLFADAAHLDEGGKVPVTDVLGMSAASFTLALESLGGKEGGLGCIEGCRFLNESEGEL